MPHKFADAAVMMAQAATAGIAAGAASVGLDGITAFGIASACSGSASAVLFRVINREETPVTGMWRRAGRGLASFLVGAQFGVWMSGTASKLPLIDGIAAPFFAGLVGYGAVAVLLSGEVRHAARDGVVAAVRAAFSKLGASVTSKGGGQ